MKIRKTVMLFVLAAAGAILLTGCGSSNSSKSTASGSDAAPKSYGKVTKLSNYKGIALTVQDTTVTDQEVEDQISTTLSSNPTKTEVDRAAKEGDTLNIDFAGTVDGTAFDGGTATGQDLKLGSNRFIDGFESGLVGASKGDKKTLNLTFPDPYTSNPDLAGKAVVFNVTVNTVSEENTPELTDDWVNTFTKGAQTTVDAYKAKVRSDLEKSKKENSDMTAENDALTDVIKNSEFQVNDDAVTYELNKQKASMQSQLAQYGIDEATYLQYVGMTQDQYDAQLKESATESVKAVLAVNAIAKKEGLKVKDTDYKYLENLYGATKEQLISQAGEDIVKRVALMYKVENFLVSNATKTVAAPTEAGTEAAAESTSAAEQETTKAQ